MKHLLWLALDGVAPDHVALSAVVAALDRAGLGVKSTVGVEISTKPWESVLEGISKVVAGPRDPQAHPALAEHRQAAELPESENVEIIGEIDDDIPRFQRERERESDERAQGATST